MDEDLILVAAFGIDATPRSRSPVEPTGFRLAFFSSNAGRASRPAARGTISLHEELHCELKR
jgi:hypothetical protein